MQLSCCLVILSFLMGDLGYCAQTDSSVSVSYTESEKQNNNQELKIIVKRKLVTTKVSKENVLQASNIDKHQNDFQISNKTQIDSIKSSRNRTLSTEDEQNALFCLEKDLLFSVKHQQCFPPLSDKACVAGQAKWFVARRSRLEGVCRKIPCSDPAAPVLHNGTCSALHTSNCPHNNRLFVNKFGRGYCDCDEGWRRHQEDELCYQDRSAGPCGPGETWLAGSCLSQDCGPDQRAWADGQCYTVDSEAGGCGLVLQAGRLVCRATEERGRGLLSGLARRCRAGRVWHKLRRRCVRLFRG